MTVFPCAGVGPCFYLDTFSDKKKKSQSSMYKTKKEHYIINVVFNKQTNKQKMLVFTLNT